MTEEPKKEELKIKDLAIKVQVLTDALLEERKKSQNLLDKIKEFEEMISKKENDIIALNQEKYDLQSKISAERQSTKDAKDMTLNKVVDKLFNKDKINFNQFDKLKEENRALAFENKQLAKKCLEEQEAYDQQKMKFDTMIALQDMEIKKTEENIEQLLQEKEKLLKNKEEVESLINTSSNLKEEYDKKHKEVDAQVAKNEEEAAMISIQDAKINSELKPKMDKIKKLQKDIKDQNNALTALKNSLTHTVLEPIDFLVEKDEVMAIKKKKEVKISFSLSQQIGTYIITLDYENKNQKMTDTISFLNVIDFGIKDEKKFEFRYVKGQEKKWTFVLDPLLIDFFEKKFKEFFDKAKEDENI